MADQIHPNEFGYWRWPSKPVEVLDKALKASFYATTDEARGRRAVDGGLAVVAVGRSSVFAAISRVAAPCAAVQEGYARRRRPTAGHILA